MDGPSTSLPSKRPSSGEDDSNPPKRARGSHTTSSLVPPPSSRSAKSYTTAGFTDKVKRHVKSMYGDRCWVCQAFPAEAAHIINKTDDQFELLTSLGIVHFGALGHESNAILLCPLCHVQFDRPNPGLVIVPSDLEWFIQWEIKDQARRVAEYHLTNTLPQRISPSAEDYGLHCRSANGATGNGTYTQYLRVDYFPVLGNRHPLIGAIGTTPWHGSPTAMIRKALVAAAMPTGLPYHVISCLDKLKMLWFVRDPAYECLADRGSGVSADPGSPRGSAGNTDRRGPDADPSPRDPGGPGNVQSDVTNTTPTHGNPGRSNSMAVSPVYVGVVTPVPRWRPLVPSPRTTDSDNSDDHHRVHRQENHKLPGNPHGWKWGPKASAQKVMDYYTLQLGAGGG